MTPAEAYRNASNKRRLNRARPMGRTVARPPRKIEAYPREPGEYDVRRQSIARDPIARGVAAGRPLRSSPTAAGFGRPGGMR